MIDPASPEFERLPKKERAKIYYFDFGWTITAIADELDEGRKTIGEWLDGIKRAPRVGIKRQRPRWVGPEFDKLFRLYEAGKLPSEIIKAVNLHPSTVYRVIDQKYGAQRQQRKAA